MTDEEKEVRMIFGIWHLVNTDQHPSYSSSSNKNVAGRDWLKNVFKMKSGKVRKQVDSW